MNQTKKVLVLLSGGQDSTTCLFWAADKWGAENVEAIIFDYGQKHSDEIGFALKNCGKLGVEATVKDLNGLLQDSALVNHEEDISAPHALAPNLPASFTPGRNLLFLVVAAAHAYGKGITDLVTGVCQTDYSGYPDCRQNTIAALEAALKLGLDKPVQIHTPLMFLTKAETFKMANDLGVLQDIIEDTLTDYNGVQVLNYWGRGNLENPASQIRKKGYDEAAEKGWVPKPEATN